MIKFLEYEKMVDPNGKAEKVKLPIRVCYSVLKKLKEELGRTLSQNDDGTDYELYETLLYYSLEKGHLMLGRTMPFKKEDMEDIMDYAYFQFLSIVPTFFEVPEPVNQTGLEKGQMQRKK